MEDAAEVKKGDAALTRGRILAAAQQVFSKQGYSETGIREIANALGLSTTILFRYFGTKAGLFEAALRDALDDEPVFPKRERFGEFIAEWLADPHLDMGPHTMIVLATGNEEAREIAARLLQELTLTPLAEWLGPPEAEARARQIIALCSGFVMYTFQLTVASGRKAIDPSMVTWLAESVQSIVDRD